MKRETRSEVVTFRTTASLLSRIKGVAGLEQRSDSQIVQFCVERYLPELERQVGIIVAREAQEVAAIPEEEHRRRALAVLPDVATKKRNK